MADEIDLDLDLTNEEEEKINKVEKRIKDLSEKVKLTAQERDELIKTKEESEVKIIAAQKEVEFYKGFTPLTSKYPGSAEYQDKILEKHKAGYDLEEATISVLFKEGKLTIPAPPPPPKENPAGGSAVNQIKSGEPKPVSEMTQMEKLEALKEAERRGDLGLR